MNSNIDKISHSYLIHFQAGLIIALLWLSNLSHAELTDQSYEDIGKQFATALNKKDMHSLTELFDMTEFAKKTARTIYESPYEINGFVTGFSKTSKEKLFNQVFAPLFTQASTAIYLRLLKDNRPLIRIDYKSNGHEYIILHVKQLNPNKLVVIDFFFMTKGAELSTSLGAASQLMLKPSESMLKQLFGKLDVDAKLLSTFKEIGMLRNSGKYKEAYQLVESLPADIKNKRVIIDLSLTLSQKINDDEYRKQLARLDKFYGSDNTTAFILIDHYFFIQQFPKMLAALDRIIGMIGEDGALLNLKATTYLSMKDYQNAKNYCKKSIQIEPQIDGAYWLLITILLKTEEYGEVIKTLDMLAKQFGYTFSAKSFEGKEIYSKLVRSPEFKARFKQTSKT